MWLRSPQSISLGSLGSLGSGWLLYLLIHFSSLVIDKDFELHSHLVAILPTDSSLNYIFLKTKKTLSLFAVVVDISLF